jgi:prepilin-type processing-associated H-X9-DG protein
MAVGQRPDTFLPPKLSSRIFHNPIRDPTLAGPRLPLVTAGILIGLLLPAVQKVREAAARTKCQNNLKQLGLAIHNYEGAFKKLPSPGEGVIPNTATKDYDTHSFFTYVLPYIEQDATYKMFDLTKVYNDGAAPNNQIAAKTQIQIFQCPSAAGVEPDPKGYGQTAYMPISYCDIDPVTGLRNTNLKSPAGLRISKYGGSRIDDIKDGTSNTLAIGEDSPYRNNETVFPFQLSTAVDPGNVDVNPSGKRAINRWADPETGNGVSGPPQGDPNSPYFQNTPGPYVNQNATPVGGSSATCPWSVNNCGPNDELASSHPGGVIVVFMDGHVGFLRDTIDGATLRYLCLPDDGQAIDSTKY